MKKDLASKTKRVARYYVVGRVRTMAARES